MPDYLSQLNSPSLVASFGVNQNRTKDGPPTGVWDHNGRPVDVVARTLYLKYFQGKKTARMRTPEEIFAEPIKLKVLKIVRRRGKGPQVVWL